MSSLFEDRRPSGRGTEAHSDDWLQHYNACAYRFVTGDLLCARSSRMAAGGRRALVAQQHIVHWGARPLDGRHDRALARRDRQARCLRVCQRVCRKLRPRRMADGTGISMLELIPGVAHDYEVKDIVAQIAPRPPARGFGRQRQVRGGRAGGHRASSRALAQTGRCDERAFGYSPRSRRVAVRAHRRAWIVQSARRFESASRTPSRDLCCATVGAVLRVALVRVGFSSTFTQPAFGWSKPCRPRWRR